MEFSCGKRYNAIDGFYKQKFGTKIAKVPLDGGFTCPNRDGKKAYGGCIYCSDRLGGDFTHPECGSLAKQFMLAKMPLDAKWNNLKYIPYFQSGSATYADIGRLKELYYEALSLPDAVGLSIATRPDCIDSKVLGLLSEISKVTFLTVELGLQSTFDKTGVLINRQTSYGEFLDSFNALKSAGISTCVHLINGLPGETKEMMLESVRRISELAPHCIKLHVLNIVRGTAAEKMYRDGKITLFGMEEYISFVCDELEIISPEIYIARLGADCERSRLVAPEWTSRKHDILNGIDRELKMRDTYQGKNSQKA